MAYYYPSFNIPDAGSVTNTDRQAPPPLEFFLVINTFQNILMPGKFMLLLDHTNNFSK